MHPLLSPLAEFLNTMSWNDIVQLAGIGIVSWLGGHAVTRGELR